MKAPDRADQTLATLDKSLSVLIVDDDVRLCETLGDSLEDKGFVVSSVADGVAAIEQMKQGIYDLILIDIMLPGMNGVETLREIKVVNPNVMIMIITGQSQLEGFVSDALWAGVDGVLRKPLDIDAVVGTIQRKMEELADLPALDLKQRRVSSDVLDLVPEEMARKYCLLPLQIDQDHLVVAMSDPGNLYAIEDLRVRTGLRIKPFMASRAAIEEALSVQYQDAREIEREIERIAPAGHLGTDEVAERLSAEMVADTPVVRAVDLMLRQAVHDNASDIHLEPQADCFRVRYRIDGVLHDAMRLPRRVHAPLLSRVKVLSNLNIAERRRPQDGQFSMQLEGKSVDFRVATLNTVYGEMGVLRVLDKAISVRGLDQIGLLPDMREICEGIIHSPWGIVLAAGPTGSGKTSTLYAALNQLDKNELKIITIEDPPEYRFDGINQVQVNRQADITFATGLRASMRLDPDVILVGEIRDQETARIAVQASLTGHLVFSSIHANDAVGAIFRLIDLGIEPFLITSALLAVLSQRLVRKVCEHCRAPREVPYRERLAFEQATGEVRAKFDYGAGCARCAETGYRGRTAGFELLIMNDDLRHKVLVGVSSDELRKAAQEAGMRSMFEDGMLKVEAGITTPSEVLRKIFTMS